MNAAQIRDEAAEISREIVRIATSEFGELRDGAVTTIVNDDLTRKGEPAVDALVRATVVIEYLAVAIAELAEQITPQA